MEIKLSCYHYGWVEGITDVVVYGLQTTFLRSKVCWKYFNGGYIWKCWQVLLLKIGVGRNFWRCSDRRCSASLWDVFVRCEPRDSTWGNSPISLLHLLPKSSPPSSRPIRYVDHWQPLAILNYVSHADDRVSSTTIVLDFYLIVFVCYYRIYFI